MFSQPFGSPFTVSSHGNDAHIAESHERIDEVDAKKSCCTGDDDAFPLQPFNAFHAEDIADVFCI